MTRKLVTIRTINKLNAINGADRIEQAEIDGWTVVVKKGEFREGDLCRFFEIDSMLPLKDEFSFLGKSTNTKQGIGYRIKTIKLRGELSQGLALPLNIVDRNNYAQSDIGKDITKNEGVWLYEPMQRQGSTSLNREVNKKDDEIFPKFLRKTDQERIQNNIGYFISKQRVRYEVTKKLDGSSCTIYYFKDKNRSILTKIKDYLFKKKFYGVCSRNVNLKEEKGNAFWDIAISEKIIEKIEGMNIAIQGELIGPKIQGNPEKVSKNGFYAFDVFDIDEQVYFSPVSRQKLLKELDIITVPVIHTGQMTFMKHPNIGSLLKYASKATNLTETGYGEGYVFKPLDSCLSESFKVISNKYLMKEK